MDLEEREGTEPIVERCEECGAKLTPQELATALESGGPFLCTVHATERLELDAGDEPA